MTVSKAEVNKNKIIGWLKEDGIDFKEMDIIKLPLMEWGLSVGKNHILIYTMKKFPDRVIVQADIDLGVTKELLNEKWDKQRLNNLLASFVATIISLNLKQKILFDDKKKVRGFRIHDFLIDSLNKENLLKTYLRITEVVILTLQSLSSSIGVEMQKLQQEQKAGSENPLAS